MSDLHKLVNLGLAVLLLWGCASSIPLDAPVVLTGDVKVTDCLGNPKRLGDFPKGDFLASNSLEESGDSLQHPVGDPDCTGRIEALQLGMPVRPGMVLHLATPSLGPGLGLGSVPTDAADVSVPLEVGAHQPQLSGALRLPVRYIAAGGRLTADETFVLATILSLHRTQNFGSGTEADDNTIARWRWILEKHKALLWNAMIDSLQLRRIVERLDNPFPSTSKTRATRTQDVATLALIVLPYRFCEILKRNLPQSEYTQITLGVFKDLCEPTSVFRHTVEAFAIYGAKKRVSGLSVLLSKQNDEANAGEGYFLRQTRFNPASFVTAELNAVRLGNRAGAEQRWSLAEWEASGICVDPTGARRVILNLQVRRDPTWFRVIRSGAPEQPTHRVRTILTPEFHARGVFAVSPELITFDPSIPASDLALLRSADLGGVRWDGVWNGSGPDPCRLR